eukprot:gene10227-21324_t
MKRQLLRAIPRRNSLSLQSRFRSEYTVISTNLPTVYTCSALEPHFDYLKWNPEAVRLFSLTPEYIPPSEFKYELPKSGIPEFAFVGRSNVGKSSLVRALLQSDIVRVSKEPGCTKTINYYAFAKETGAHDLYLVDLPGYGFAKVAKKERADWQGVIDNYLIHRDFTTLRRVYVLIDSRRGVQPHDIEMLDMLNTAKISNQVILTKSDLISPAILKRILEELFHEIQGRRRQASIPIVHVISSLYGDGINVLKQSMAESFLEKSNIHYRFDFQCLWSIRFKPLATTFSE